jgi:hypothetical protein
MAQYPLATDSLLLLYYEDPGAESIKQWKRIVKSFQAFPVKLDTANRSKAVDLYRKKCIFLMNDTNDLLLLDRKGIIRGHYLSSDREEVDRLITEVTILLKKY